MGYGTGKRIVLASASNVRARIMKSAGIPFEVDHADIDEPTGRRSCREEGISVGETAACLAAQKAREVSRRKRDSLVIGADQILEAEGRWFEKASSLAEARECLRRLRGRTHHLYSAVVVVENGETLWNHVSEAELTMRMFTDNFLDRYISRQGKNILEAVGCYKMEEGGVRLFAAVRGDHYAILGLPIVPLVTFLESQGVLDL
jgi:septum formation protein